MVPGNATLRTAEQPMGVPMGRANRKDSPLLRLYEGHTPRLVVLIIIAAAIPLLIFAGWMAYLLADRERAESRRVVAVSVLRVAEQVSSELTKELDVAKALAGSVQLDRPDLATFYEEARRLTAARPLWETVSLVDPHNVQLLNILRPYGDELPPAANDGSLAQALREHRPAIGGIGPVGSLSGKRLVYLRVPVMRTGTLSYVLNVGLVPAGISSILRNAGAPEGWSGVIVDAEGNIVARTIDGNEDLGQPASDAVRAAIARSPEGFYKGRTGEGVEVETVYRTLLQPRGWSVHFGVPTEALNAPVLHSFYALVAGGLASLALGGGLAALVGRDIAQRRREEATRSALELSLSEERGAVAIDAAELGTWRWDAAAEEVTGSERTRDLFKLPQREPILHKEFAWPAAEFLAAVHQEDRDALTRALRHCLANRSAIDLELRASSANGLRWIRLTGRLPPTQPEASQVIHGVVADIEPRKRAEADRLDLLRRLAEAQESEQRRIARELHDQVGQTLTGLSLGLKGLQSMTETGGSSAVLRDRISWLMDLTKNISRDIHRAAADLRPTAIDDIGLEKALAAHLEEWTKTSGVPVDLQRLGPARTIPLAIETAVYRIVQEALTNVAKHANACAVSVVIELREHFVRLVIEDDGVGLDPERVREGPVIRTADNRVCLGLTGIRERLAVLRGSMTIESAPDTGTTLFVYIPIPPGEEAPI
jgi:two-component system, NarL family, sensor histidine kinase UhpB